MPSFTPRAQLIKTAGPEKQNVGNINDSFDKIDTLLGSQEITSTTRPSTPFIGQKIWESDTKQERIWTGAQWLWNGGVRPMARMEVNVPSAGLGVNADNPVALVLTPTILAGGITSDASGGFNFPRVKDPGVYRVELRARAFFSTGVAIGAGATVMALGLYSDALLYQRRIDQAIAYPPGASNSLSVNMASTEYVELKAREAVLPLFYRIGGAADWKIQEGTFTTFSIEWVGATNTNG